MEGLLSTGPTPFSFFFIFLTNLTTKCNTNFHIKIYLDLVEILENISGNGEEKKKENNFLKEKSDFGFT